MAAVPGARAGSRFGPYYLKRLLGSGGMGEVYEAQHTVKQWTVAVKLLSESFSADPVFRKRLMREARLAGRLQEPHVVPIHDYGEIDGQLFLEMRLVDGTDLDGVLKRFGPLTPPRAVTIITQVASALDAAHAAGVMHRDVKPQNILLTRDDFVYLVDFGIASATSDERLTQLGTAVGTWKYMAPERFSDAEVTYRADIYALACVLHECLTGAAPYRSDSAGVLIGAHLHSPIPQASRLRPGIPAGFDAVVARGMAKNPHDRYASAGDLALAAHQALSDPEQDHATTLLRRSREMAAPPAGAAAPVTHANPPPGYSAPPNPAVQPATGWPPANNPNPSWPPATTPASVGSWGPPGSPPPQHPGPPYYPPPAPTPKRNPWPIVAGVAILLVAILAAVSIWAGTRPGKKTDQPAAAETTTTSRSTTTTETTSPRPSGANARLLSLLPKGYAPGMCRPEDVDPTAIWHNAVAIAKCGAPSDPGGPPSALYALFPDLDTLTDAFNATTPSEKRQSTCPQNKASPGNWWDNDNPNVVLGQIECLYNGADPEFEWSNTSELLIGAVTGAQQGPTLDDLYAWWSKYT
jgi:serine/threonine protein kinase